MARTLPSVDVYLFPAVVGGGLGDIEEVLAAGRLLARHGFPTFLYRRNGRPLPRSVDGPWDWPRPLHRISELRPRGDGAATLAASWGISAAPSRDEPLGRAGPWAEEAAEIERWYGSDRTIHVSFEEFGRTLTTREQEGERLREGGVPLRRIATRLRGWSRGPEARALHAAFRRFRAFDRANVLHLYPTFAPSRGFAREYPEAVQCGPFWPEPGGRRAPAPPPPNPRRPGPFRVVWYASPASSERVAPELLHGAGQVGRPVEMAVRSDRRFATRPPPRVRVRWLPAERPGRWKRAFRAADLRIVTGSRTLLEAMVLGRPFLYFNGIVGGGRAARRHRPEKLVGLLRVWFAAGGDRSLYRAFADFGRGRSVAPITARVLTSSRARSGFPHAFAPPAFDPPYEDGRRLLLRILEPFGRGSASEEVVRATREGRLGRVTSRSRGPPEPRRFRPAVRLSEVPRLGADGRGGHLARGRRPNAPP
ncbi:MAG TPA: hypothetical protein VFF67_04200 [Thermoplasmata archaeon]|nr:hypothetical protein [Thermoplasmata archaeon]